MPTTSLGAPYPSLSSEANVPVDIQQLAQWATDQFQELAVTTANVPGNGTFTSSAKVKRFGKKVVLYGSFVRPSGFSTSFVEAGTIPVGLRPDEDIAFPVSKIFGSAVDYSIQVTAAGSLQIRMSAASSGNMLVSGFSWVTP